MQTPSMSGGRYILPSFEEKTSYGTRTVDPYTRLFRERVVFLTSPVDPTSSNDIMSQLLVLDSMGDDEITLYINSPGGSFEDMTAIYDTINYIASPVSTICLGRAEGVASILLAAGEKGSRAALPNSKIVLFQPTAYATERGQASDIRIEANEILRRRKWMEDTLVELTGQTHKKVNTDIERNFYLTTEKATEYGIIDGILAPRKAKK